MLKKFIQPIRKIILPRSEKYYTEPLLSELKYRLLSGLGQHLVTPVPNCFLEMQVILPDGSVTHHHKQRSHSWNRNAYNLMFGQMTAKQPKDTTFGAGKLNSKGTNGSTYYGTTNTDTLSFQMNVDGIAADTVEGYLATAGTATKGIVVGSGTDVEDFEGNALQTLIANGTGAGQLSYIASEAHVIAYDAGTKTFSCVLARYFNNNSGGNVAVNEVGLYGSINSPATTGDTTVKVMFSRDVLGATVTIPNSGQLKVTYTISLVYPA